MNYRSVLTLGCLVAGLAVPAAHAAISMKLVTANSGWVSTGNHVLWTSDAGAAWKEITPPDSAAIHGVFFLDTAHGWVLRSRAAQAPEMARTSDGGATWQAAGFPLGAEDAARFGGSAALDFVDVSHGWAMLRQIANSNFSIGILFATSDGGANWKKLAAPPVGDPVRFVTRTDGWVAGGPTGNKLYVTRDGGNTWSAARVPEIAAQAEVRYSLPAFQNSTDGVLAARYLSPDHSSVTVLETRDGGKTWQARGAPAGTGSERSPAVALVDGHAIEVSSSHAGLLTTAVDQYPAVSDGLLSRDANVVSADFVSTRQGWILAQEGHCAGYKTDCSQQTKLLATSDSGKTFHDITPRWIQAAVAESAVQPLSTVVGTGEGFDGCDPTTSDLAAWYKDSPYNYVNVYIGGNNAYCPQPGLNTSFVNTVVGQGWGLIPTWVGPQAPHSCTSCGSCSSFSTNTTTAASQAKSQAQSAASKMSSIGLSGTIVYYDLEEYTDSSSCSAAAKAFVNEWVEELHTLGYSAGVYGSPDNANTDWLNISHPPDDVWIALWNGVKSTTNLSPIPNSDWDNNQRIHQYDYLGNQTYGGITINIDGDYLGGAVAK
jgi:photosystem II stability/assembly factor-like uncharacterized protein